MEPRRAAMAHALQFRECMPPRRTRRASPVDIAELVIEPPWWATFVRWFVRDVPPPEPPLDRRGRWPAARRVIR
jgi:hypothetical protein